MPIKQPYSGLYRNTVSYLGGLVVMAGAALILFLMLIELSIQSPSPYIGMFTYLFMPGVVMVGVAMFLYGMRREAVRRRRTGEAQALPYPRVDLNDPRHRKRFAYSLVFGSLLGILLTFAGYNGFLYTESVAFCGTVCHSVMEPEHTAYLSSPHARVKCVDCHVGHGASWYVKSKLSGARQVYAVLFNTHERPIPVPVENLRPARETCEECHWPQKFYGARLMQIPHFRFNEQNTPEQITLMLKTGGGGVNLGDSPGIHWHMIIGNDITFAATDRQLQSIPWVRSKHADGTVVEYVDASANLTAEQIQALPHHEMDCMHCHNRPTHGFPPPEGAVDRALINDEISRTLPWIKKVLVDALIVDYPTRQAAHEGLSKEVLGFYEKEYPELMQSRRNDIDTATKAAIAIYDRSVFPQMNVNWKTYPVNVGHRNWPGCFRCHDGKHLSKDGAVLKMTCDGTCHSMPKRGPIAGLGQEAEDASTDWHPWDMPAKNIAIQAHDQILCSTCHAAGFRPRRECSDCHR